MDQPQTSPTDTWLKVPSDHVEAVIKLVRSLCPGPREAFGVLLAAIHEIDIVHREEGKTHQDLINGVVKTLKYFEAEDVAATKPN